VTVTGPPGQPGLTLTGPPGATVTQTQTVTEQLACPKPTNSAPVTPQDTSDDATWGCSPGYVCMPPMPNGCTLWVDPPEADYLCDAKFCKPAPDFTDVVWPKGETTYYPPTKGYFNLNPHAFGLDYGIFVEKIVTLFVIGDVSSKAFTTGNWKSQSAFSHFPPAAAATSAVIKREILKRDNTIVPALCYAQCNNCMLEAQKVGKTPELCRSGSAFQSDYSSCNECVSANGDTTKTSLQTYVNPQFAQFIDFCNAKAPQSIVEPPSSTSTATVVPLPQTQSVVVATSTGPTPTRNVAVTSQASANSNTEPVILSSTSAPAANPASSAVSTASANAGAIGSSSTTVQSSASATSSGPAQVTANAADASRPSAFIMIVALLLAAFFTLL